MINYLLLTKPGIILGNLFTVAAGFFLASQGHFYAGLFFATLTGLAFIIASACIFNNYIDREIDKKMERTKTRALVTGLISEKNALGLAIVLAIVGHVVLFIYTNLLTVLVASCGFFVYVVLYSLWKGRTIYGTAIGSIAGAVPPVVGYCAVSNQFDAGALILFLMMILWQMPHFFAIAFLHFDDYAAAGIPLLPIKKGLFRTKVHMVLYIIGFVLTTALLTYFGYTGYVYATVTTGLGLIWLVLCLQGFTCKNDLRWGRQMFRLSLVVIAIVCMIIPFDTVVRA